MASLFDHVVIYQVEATCKTPLRTGNADGDVEKILRYKDGTPFIQGNSISGAMRNWLEENYGEKTGRVLFGNRSENNGVSIKKNAETADQSAEGHLIISDGVFSQSAVDAARTGVVIDQHTGTARKDIGGLFRVSHIVTGEKMHFNITWTGMEKQISQIEFIEKMLSAINQGAIRLGAKKTSGFGVLTLRVKKKMFDLRDEKDRLDWLEDRVDGVSLKLKDIQEKAETEFIIQGIADAILIKSAAAEYTRDGVRYITNMMEGKLPVIPGSSIKGAIRARVTSIVEVLNLPLSIVEEMFGNSMDNQEEQKAGKVYFEDILVDQAKKEKIARIRINRFTGGVIRGSLFNEEPLSTKVKIRVLVPDNPVYCMLLLFAFRDLGLGLYNLGSGGSIGRGYITVDTLEAVSGTGEKLRFRFQNAQTCTCEEGENLLKMWGEELEKYKNEE